MTNDTGTDRGSDNAGRRRQQLRVEFDLVPRRDCACPLTGIDGDVVDVRQQLAGETCQTDVTVQSEDCQCSNCQTDTDIIHTRSDLSEACPCDVFSTLGCVPKVTDATDDRIRIETFLPDRELLSELVDGLRAVVDEFHLRRLKRIANTDDDNAVEHVTLELGRLTQKQREAAMRAVTAGYYASPRAVTLGELADDLEISKSALSQRLNTVESKLATSAFTQATAQG